MVPRFIFAWQESTDLVPRSGSGCQDISKKKMEQQKKMDAAMITVEANTYVYTRSASRFFGVPSRSHRAIYRRSCGFFIVACIIK